MAVDTIKVKISGEWKPITINYTKVGGTWKDVITIWIKISGKWVRRQNQ